MLVSIEYKTFLQQIKNKSATESFSTKMKEFQGLCLAMGGMFFCGVLSINLFDCQLHESKPPLVRNWNSLQIKCLRFGCTMYWLTISLAVPSPSSVSHTYVIVGSTLPPQICSLFHVFIETHQSTEYTEYIQLEKRAYHFLLHQSGTSRDSTLFVTVLPFDF